MPQTFVVDQAATFQGVALLSAEPRIAFGTRDQQETTKDGVPRWEVQLVCGFRDNFGKTNHEVIKVSVNSPRNPAEGLAPYTPVQLVNFVVGVMEKTKGDQIIGVQVWYRADEIRSLMAAPQNGGGRRGSAEG